MLILMNTDGTTHNEFYFLHLRCVLCKLKHHIAALGATAHFVWHVSLFFSLLFPTFSCSSTPLTQNLILKQDYFKTTQVTS